MHVHVYELIMVKILLGYILLRCHHWISEQPFTLPVNSCLEIQLQLRSLMAVKIKISICKWIFIHEFNCKRLSRDSKCSNIKPSQLSAEINTELLCATAWCRTNIVDFYESTTWWLSTCSMSHANNEFVTTLNCCLI